MHSKFLIFSVIIHILNLVTIIFNIQERYNFDINGSYTRKKISSCYRQHKYKLLVRVKKDLERGIEPLKPSYVKQEDWDAFVAKTKDEEFDVSFCIQDSLSLNLSYPASASGNFWNNISSSLKSTIYIFFQRISKKNKASRSSVHKRKLVSSNPTLSSVVLLLDMISDIHLWY